MIRLIWMNVLKYVLPCMMICALKGQSWTVTLDDLGTFSSPRVTDLNKDGIMDIIMGAGRQEFVRCDTAIFALDGKNGQMMWKIDARDQIFGSAGLLDITGDSIDDVFIGGRSAVLKAIDGHSGKLIWEFFQEDDTAASRSQQLYNFYNPQFIPDQDGDGLQDILISNGGDVMVEAYDPKRAAGYLMVISSASGKQLAKARMPDGKEIYMSVVVDDIDRNDTLEIIYGTGGETIGGHLFLTTLESMMNEDLSQSVVLASSEEKGFISPPVLVDLNQDGVKDIVANAVAGTTLALNGMDYSLMWYVNRPNTEIYASMAVADVNNDDIPDIFASYAVGIWPLLISTKPLLINGANGQIMMEDSIGFYQTSSPIMADFNNDGHTDGLMSINYNKLNESGEHIVHNTLLVYDFYQGKKHILKEPVIGANVSSTPWMGDLDNDGWLDIIHCNMTTPDKAYTFGGFNIHRTSTHIPAQKTSIWGAYMGSRYDGIYIGSYKN